MIDTTSIGYGASPSESAHLDSRAADPRDRSWLEAQARRFSALLSESSPRHTSLLPGDTSSPGPLSGRLQKLDPTTQAEVDISPQLRSLPLPDLTADVQPPPLAPGHSDATLAQLLEQHIRSLMVAQASDSSGSQTVRLELSNAVLPETILSLRRNSNGLWHLTASSRSRVSLELLGRNAPELVDRFAQASLGSLEVIAQLDLDEG